MIAIFRPTKQRGMTLVELVVAVAILGILAAIAIPNFISYRYIFRFNNDAAQLEYLVKYARIYAMENSVNVGLCVQPGNGGTLTITDLGADRQADACDGGEAVRSLITEDHVQLSTTVADHRMKFDSRGIMIQPGLGGTICVYYDHRAFKVILGPASLRMEENTAC